MSVKASTWAWAQEIPYAEKLVLLALADHADVEGVCWPSLKHLGKKTGIDHTRISKLIKSLRERGILSIEYRKVAGVQRSNRYTLHLGLMIIPVVPRASGWLSPEQPPGCPQSKLETSIETSLESSTTPDGGMDKNQTPFSSGENKEMPKKCGQDSVDAVMASEEQNRLTLDEALSLSRKYEGPYKVKDLRRVWRTLWAEQGFGYCRPWNRKQEGQARLFAKGFQDTLDPLDVLVSVFRHWNRFRQKTDVWKPPTQPTLSFLLTHADRAGQLHAELHTIAKPKKAVGVFANSDLTKETVTPDNVTNETDDDDMLAVLEAYQDKL